MDNHAHAPSRTGGYCRRCGQRSYAPVHDIDGDSAYEIARRDDQIADLTDLLKHRMSTTRGLTHRAVNAERDRDACRDAIAAARREARTSGPDVAARVLEALNTTGRSRA